MVEMGWERDLGTEGGDIVRAWVNKRDREVITISVEPDGSLYGEYYPEEEEGLYLLLLETILTKSFRELDEWLKKVSGGEIELTPEDIDDINKRIMEKIKRKEGLIK